MLRAIADKDGSQYRSVKVIREKSMRVETLQCNVSTWLVNEEIIEMRTVLGRQLWQFLEVLRF